MTDKYDLPPYVLSRVRYYDGEFLKDEDFIDEQKYHMDRSRRHARLMHAPGIAEGLDLSIIRDSEGLKLKVTAGTALDGLGRQIILDKDRFIAPKPEWMGTLWMTLRFNELEDHPANANPSTGGVSGNTRFSQAPLIEVVADLTPLQVKYPVVLGQVRFVAGQAPVVLGPRTFAGLRLPIPGAGFITLQATEDPSASPSLSIAFKGPLDVLGSQRIGGTLTVNDNVGIGTAAPAARLSVVAPVMAQLDGSAHSTAFLVTAGALGQSQDSELALASFGFRSPNNTSLGVRALRFAGGNDWRTTSIGLCMDVDNTVRPSDAALWLSSSGNVGISTPNPQAKLHVAGGNALFTGSVTVGAGGVGTLKTRHIDGKQHGNDDPDRLYLNYSTQLPVVIGSSAARGGLELYGDLAILNSPANDKEPALSRLSLVTRGPEGKQTYWSLYTAAVGGGWGVNPNAFEIWEYPATSSRFQLRPGGNTILCPRGGDAGIGTTEPQARLHVAGGNALFTGDLTVGAGGCGFLKTRHIDGKSYQNDGPDHLYLNWDTGKWVCIGRKETPSILEVNGSVHVGGGNAFFDGDVIVSKPPPDDTTEALSRLSLSNRGPGGTSATWSLYTAAVGGGWGVVPNAFEIWEYGATAGPRFRLLPRGDTLLCPSVGNVGIGTQPQAKLHVSGGDALFTGHVTVGAGGDAILRTRHIFGKSTQNDDPDNLYLNWNIGKRVVIGSPSTPSPLGINGWLEIAPSPAPADDMTPASSLISLFTRAPGGRQLVWHLQAAAAGGGWGGVNPNAFEIWESWMGGPTSSRLQLRPGGDTILCPSSGSVGIGGPIAPKSQARLYVIGSVEATGSVKSTEHTSWGVVITEPINPTRWFKIAFAGVATGNVAPVSFYYSTGKGATLTPEGEWIRPSDISLKENLFDLCDTLDKVMKLRPVTFDWKSTHTRDIGFVAQDVEQVFPEIVSSVCLDQDTLPLKGLSYQALGVITIAALKEMKAHYDERLNHLEQQLRALSARLTH